MRKLEKYEEGKDQYILGNGFSLKRAEFKEFGIHYAIYAGRDFEFTYNWIKLSQNSYYDENAYWIIKDNIKVGGVVIEPNYSSHFFVLSPYIIDKFTILSELNKTLIQWSDESKMIELFIVDPKDVDLYSSLGFRRRFVRRTMIRPTEVFENIKWGKDLIIKIPTIENIKEIGKVLHQSYEGGVHYEEFSRNSLDDEIEITELFLNRYISTSSLHASTLVYDKSSNELIGVCLAGKNKDDDYEFSKINQVGVLPDYRGQGIAEKMIKRALTVLKDISPATKLDVTVGNSAEALYYKMGFYAGIQTIAMYKKI